MNAPAYLSPYILIGSIAIMLSLVFGLRAALIRAGWPGPQRSMIVLSAAAVLVVWFLAALNLSIGGAFHSGSNGIPTIQYAIFAPILIGALLLWGSATARRVLDAVPQSWLVGVQLYRALGVIFLILYAGGELPGLFAWPAGLGDIIVGLLAPFVAMAYARQSESAGNLVAAWNVFGILDLAVAITTGFLTAQSALHPLSIEPVNVLIDAYPLAMIPTFAVPISIILHIASLTKLRRDAAESAIGYAV